MADPFEFEVGAFDTLARTLILMGDAAMPALAATLFEKGETIMTRSKAEFVPVKEGILRGSGYVQPPVIDQDEVSVTLGFGGPAGAYALVQHENTEFQHPNGGQAKYLEQPVLEAIPTFPDDLAAGVSARFAEIAGGQ